MKGNDKYINRYPERDLVQILKESGYHSSEWEETDPEEEWTVVQPAVVEDEVIITEAIKEKTTSLYIYEKWWRSSAVCILYMKFLFLLNINANLTYIFKLKKLLQDRIDPTVELLRKKEQKLKQKRVRKDKTISVPPIGAPSWCLTSEALEKFGRSTDNIPNYDPEDEDIEDIEDVEDRNSDHQDNESDSNNNNTAKSSKRNKRKNKRNKEKKKKNKKSKTRK
jgi:hypothetical protein